MLILKFVSLTVFVIGVQYTTDKESSRIKTEQIARRCTRYTAWLWFASKLLQKREPVYCVDKCTLLMLFAFSEVRQSQKSV
ncbi:hypothetical protein T07_8763 [Trichinella nelsoni]|uniref:Secreted protein n=1 Tax=Trichinella nelsoni TaxID=6336 RepID=A0A0V0RP72_9BILA|nr:hypothetical protein T07_8763 [Trichinella nelsoni]